VGTSLRFARDLIRIADRKHRGQARRWKRKIEHLRASGADPVEVRVERAMDHNVSGRQIETAARAGFMVTARQDHRDITMFMAVSWQGERRSKPFAAKTGRSEVGGYGH
jgi:hypothetical protein